ncbi:hypothetical protein K525DRAFT_238039 [Schizophyllum commune Loenen D]|nr:hypothetical protein K525DRAFT_238039 [Schizophyllum commune Loenen D]
MSRGLERLSEATKTRLRSTQILTSLPQLVSELVQNSLDAGARHVDVGVNCEEYGCWVRDDGCGMGRQDLDALAVGGGGERYVSSKVYAPDQIGEQAMFGFRGEALASAADLCCLEIASRTARSRESWSIILKDRKTLYNGPAVRWRRETPGTVVCVRDAFYNLPVRRRSHPAPPRTLELIRQELSAYALVFPYVTFSLENTSNSQQSTSYANSTFRIPATNSMLTTFRHIHGRALVQHVDEIKVEQGRLSIEGFISLEGTASKAGDSNYYVNRHPLAPSDMHRLIDQRFTSSSFGKHALDEDGQNDLPLATSPAVRRSPRKSEKRPVYVLNITVPSHQVDNCLEPAKAEVNFEDRRSVIDLLDKAISSFLSRNGFRASTPSPRKRRKISLDGLGVEVTPPRRAASMPKRTSVPVYISRASSFPVANAHSTDERPSTATRCGDDEEMWTDETTGEVYIIDKRSGNSYRLKDERQRDAEVEDDPNGTSHRGARRTLKLGQQSNATLGETPSWIRKALEVRNRVRAVETSSLPRCCPDGQQEPQRALSFQQRRMLQEHQARANQPQGRTAQEERQAYQFTTDDLRRARVIAQVDCKFIACMMQSVAAQAGDDNLEKQRGRSGLVLIDQHAADERVRVERYMRELCTGFAAARAGLQGVRCRVLDPPKAILLTRKERQQLYVEENRRAFGWWGFRFADEGEDAHALEGEMDDVGKGGSAYAQVEFVFVPEMIAEKLLLENELRDLVKGYLAKLADEGAPPRTSSVAPDSAFSWLKALRWCPKELVDLLNSKACRGAIMFNDPLSIPQCEKLIKQLTEMAFPFQCAHGR